MKIKSLFADYSGEATLVSDHELSAGAPVLVFWDGKSIRPGDIDLVGWQLVEATDDERRALRAAGYVMPDAHGVNA